MEQLIYMGEVYIDRGRDKPCYDSLGFYGAEWTIQKDGKEWTTNNLWSDVFRDAGHYDGEPDNCVILQPVTRISMTSGIKRTLWLPMITPYQAGLLEAGKHIQEVLTNYTDDQREFLLTGITAEEWDAAFKEEDDE